MVYRRVHSATPLAGFWSTVGGFLEDVGGRAVDVARDGLAAAVDVIQHGTEEQIAAILEQSISPETRAELEREYLARKAREAGAVAADNWIPLALGGAALLYLLLK